MGNHPAPAAQEEPKLRRWFRDPLVGCMATAALLYLSFFPANLGWLGWIAIVPLLAVIVRPPPARMYWSVWLGGMTFGLAALQWVRLASEPMFFCWIGLALLISAHFLVFVWLTRRLTLRAGWPLALAAPAVWTALEFGRAHLGIGFPWYYLGHSQHEALAVIQIADIFGAYGVSFLVMLVNVAIFSAGQALLPVLAAKHGAITAKAVAYKAFVPAIVALALWVGALIYGFWRLGQTDFQQGPRLALLQGNMPQYIRNDKDEWKRMAEHFGGLARQAADSRPDLIVWSETSCYFDWMRIDPNCPKDAITPDWRQWHEESPLFLREITYNGIPTLLGVSASCLEADGKRHKYNAALLVDGDARAHNRYDKIYRIPFGEYIPWENTIPIMKWLSPYDEENQYGITPGKEFTSFTIPRTGYRFGVLICYEDSVPHLAPDYLRGSEPPDFFVNISNDGWFKGSSEHEQHLVAARFRAIECRRALARSVNMGISAVIDGNGRLVAMPGPTWGQSKDVATVVTAAVPLDKRWSLYVFWGDVLAWACVVASIGGVFVRRRKE